METMTGYEITNTEGVTGGNWERVFANRDEAAAAIAATLGWDAWVCSPSFATSDENIAWCVYPSQEECNSDAEGAYAPRVVTCQTELDDDDADESEYDDSYAGLE